MGDVEVTSGGGQILHTVSIRSQLSQGTGSFRFHCHGRGGTRNPFPGTGRFGQRRVPLEVSG